MKKINFFLNALAVVATAGMFSSCFSDPYVGMTDPDLIVDPTVSASAEAGYTVKVNTNVAASLKYNGAAVAATFNPQTSGTLHVEAANYVSQDINITLGANKDIVIDVNLIKTPTSAVDVDQANNATTDTPVTNSQENQNEYGNASIVVPATATTTGVAGTENFGIGIYTVQGTAEAEPSVNQEVSSDVIVAVCEPSGAVFSEPVTITVDAANAAGLSFDCINGTEKVAVNVQANSLSAQVGHFSAWNFKLNAKVMNIETTSATLFEGSILVNEGDNEIRYQANTGVTSSRSGVVESFLLSQFGSKAGKVSKVSVIRSSGTGSATIRVSQEKKVVTYNSGSQTFTATVYGAVKVDVLNVTYDTTGHSGGHGGN